MFQDLASCLVTDFGSSNLVKVGGRDPGALLFVWFPILLPLAKIHFCVRALALLLGLASLLRRIEAVQQS